MSIQARRGLLLRDGQLQCCAHQLGMHGRRHLPAHVLAGVQVQHHRQVQPAAALTDLGDVAHPGVVGAARVEAQRQHTSGDRQRMTAVGGVTELAPPQGSQPFLTHQTPYCVASDAKPLSTQHRAKATAAINAATGGGLRLQLRADQSGVKHALGALAVTVVA